jgi:single-strand DNA-binding protein
MASLNKIMLIGRLTRDPELKFLPNGTPKAELRLATSREWKDKNGEKQKETCYVDVIVWSRQAEIAKQYLAKGRQIFVEGRLDYREWEKDGVKRSKHEVVADVVQFLCAACASRSPTSAARSSKAVAATSTSATTGRRSAGSSSTPAGPGCGATTADGSS